MSHHEHLRQAPVRVSIGYTARDMFKITPITLLLACHGGPSPDEGSIEPSAWSWDAPEDLSPVYDEMLVTGAIQALADNALSLTSQPIFEGYDAAMALADGSCPA